MEPPSDIQTFFARLLDVVGYTAKEKEQKLSLLNDILGRGIAVDALEALDKEDLAALTEQLQKAPDSLPRFLKERLGEKRFGVIVKNSVSKNLGSYLDVIYDGANPAQKPDIEKIVKQFSGLPAQEA